jgi:hypothetical protein
LALTAIGYLLEDIRFEAGQELLPGAFLELRPHASRHHGF